MQEGHKSYHGTVQAKQWDYSGVLSCYGLLGYLGSSLGERERARFGFQLAPKGNLDRKGYHGAQGLSLGGYTLGEEVPEKGLDQG